VPLKAEEYESVKIPPGKVRREHLALHSYLYQTQASPEFPVPNSGLLWEVSAVLDTRAQPGASAGEWIGWVESRPLSTRLVSASHKHVHQYLATGFTNAAKKMMLADRKWISERDAYRRTALDIAVERNQTGLVAWMLDNGAILNPPDLQEPNALFRANRASMVRFLIERGSKLNYRHYGRNLLNDASGKWAHAKEGEDKRNRREILEIYLDAGLSIDFETSINLGDLNLVQEQLRKSPELAWKGTHLLDAVGLGRFEICQRMVETPGFDFERIEPAWNPAQTAVRHPRILKMFVDAGLDLQRPIPQRGGTGIMIVNDQSPLLHYAVNRMKPVEVKLLLDLGADVFAVNEESFFRQPLQTALDVAALSGTVENGMVLLNHPSFAAAEVVARKALLDQSMPLAIGGVSNFVETNRAELVAVMLEKGARVNGRQVEAALHDAALTMWTWDRSSRELLKILRSFVKHGAKPDIFTATAMGDEARVSELLKADPRRANDRVRGLPTLHLAVRLGHGEIVKQLLAAGAHADTRNTHRDSLGMSTALYWAAMQDRVAIARMLIKAGTRINSRGSQRDTVLHEAARWGSVAVAKLLLENGVPTDVKDKYDMTALDWARQNRELNERGEELIQLLESTPK